MHASVDQKSTSTLKKNKIQLSSNKRSSMAFESVKDSRKQHSGDYESAHITMHTKSSAMKRIGQD